MPYIQPKHEVGDTVYFFDSRVDSVRRGKVQSIVATQTERFGPFRPVYQARQHGDNNVLWHLAEDEVHSCADNAWPAEPAPAPEPAFQPAAEIVTPPEPAAG